MGNINHLSPLPETKADQQFLLQLPDDLQFACTVLDSSLNRDIISMGSITIATIVARVKESLGLLPTSVPTTIVMSNAILESIKLCGFPSPEIILKNLEDRRNKLKKTLDKVI